MQDYEIQFKNLFVTCNTVSECKITYRSHARTYHPDTSNYPHTVFASFNNQYELLTIAIILTY